MTANGRDPNPDRTPNRLIHEVSPYLQQHAYNPVDWYPWGDEAFNTASAQNRPILLSIGYSACHWCHVMERESFENPDIAQLMNDNFVNIKVDREERPDLDHVYQMICQATTHQGGWPLTVFLTPDRRPFFVGTYYPPEDRYGRPGFSRLLRSLALAWKEQRDEVERVAGQWTANLQQFDRVPVAADLPERAVIAAAARDLADDVDRTNGGFGTQPKFPNPDALQLLLEEFQSTGEREYLDLVCLTLQKMAQGGIYDHLAGGFHRYSVDAHWAVPHFEKMLYDNALLVPVYIAAYQLTGDDLYERIARETLNYVQQEMTSALGGFYSTQDADSEGEEGKFFVWTPSDVRAVLGPEDGDLACRYFGITPEGNFEDGTTVLHIAMSAAEAGAPLGLSPAESARRLLVARHQLWAAREEREKPFRDEKILTGWNGLMISAFARAAQVFVDPGYTLSARRAVHFIQERLLDEDGGLLRRYKDGKAEIPAFLEDYAYLAAGMLDLYEATFETEYLDLAIRLTDETVARFWDAENAGFYLAPAGTADLITRPRDVTDSAIPSPNSIAVRNLLRCYPFTGNEGFRAMAEKVFRHYGVYMQQAPRGVASLISAFALYLSGGTEITIVAAPDDGSARSWLKDIHQRYLPDRVLSWRKMDDRDGGPTLYVCRNFTCSPPLTSWSDAEAWMKR